MTHKFETEIFGTRSQNYIPGYDVAVLEKTGHIFIRGSSRNGVFSEF